jgi:Holliday junction resolvasome RuvABC endonuclease subunit
MQSGISQAGIVYQEIKDYSIKKALSGNGQASKM